MDLHELASLATALGARKVSTSGDRVRCECILSQWTHRSGRDSHPSMVLFPEGKHGDPIYACMGCHEKGSVKDLVLFMWSKGLLANPIGWVELVEGEPGGEMPDTEVGRIAKHVAEMDHAALMRAAFSSNRVSKFVDTSEELPELPEDAYSKFSGSVPKYALDRGLTVETCKAWDLGHDRYHRRLMFPIRDRKGRLVATSGRLYACPKCGCSKFVKPDGGHEVCERCGKKAPPKYMHSKGFKRNLILLGEDRVQDNAEDGRVYVVEGHLDAVRLWQSGYRPAVAILGSALGNGQANKLVRYFQRIIVVGDGDKAGKDMGEQVRDRIGERVQVVVKTCPEGMDPGSMTTEQLSELLGKPSLDIGKRMSNLSL